MSSDFKEKLYSNYYEIQSQYNDLSKELRLREPYIRALIERHVPKDRNLRILDLGSGYGAMVYFLKKMGYENLQGVDVSPQNVQIAKQLNIDCIEQTKAQDYLEKQEKHSWDIILALDVLEHFTRAELMSVMEQIQRILKPKGKLILHVPNGEAIFSGAVFFSDLTHELAFTRRSILQLSKCAGFKKAIFYEDVPIVHGVKSAIRHVVWKIVRNFFRMIYISETGEASSDLILSQNLLAVIEK
jgi:2-polyprenyl-3-methyl-5-hydroxy-6-metoxy-1,4-benzoquinol methylase